MNERITLLALKASDPKTGWLDRQKFAELIVRECANLFEIEYGTSEVSGNEVARVLQRHFGVEK